jgi:hypothetical protein
MEYGCVVTNVSTTEELIELRMGEHALLNDIRPFGLGYPVTYRSADWVSLQHLEDNPATSNELAEARRLSRLERGASASAHSQGAARRFVIIFSLLSVGGFCLYGWTLLKKQEQQKQNK